MPRSQPWDVMVDSFFWRDPEEPTDLTGFNSSLNPNPGQLSGWQKRTLNPKPEVRLAEAENLLENPPEIRLDGTAEVEHAL